MKVLKILSRIVIAWLLLAPIPLIVTYLFGLKLDWQGAWHTAVTLWSMPVFLLAVAIDPVARGALDLPHYALVYLALTIAFVGVRRMRRAHRAARAAA